MASARIRHAATQREFEATRDELITLGYSIKSEGEKMIVLKKETWGSMGTHLAIALLTIWWTFGVGNLVYGLFAHKADEVNLRLDDYDPTVPTEALPA
jgi:hypothetical protein